MTDLFKFLQDTPLNERIAALREGNEDEIDNAEVEEVVQKIGRESAANYEPTDDDREHIRRLLLEPGWAVLLKLLDSDIRRSEDAAKRVSLSNPLGDGLKEVWATVAYSQKARNRILELAENEIRKLKAKR